MDNQRELERKSLLQKIWSIADDLRGSLDGWDFKSYILGFLFYRFLSENITNKINESMGAEFDFTNWDESTATEESLYDLKSKIGFYISPKNLFCNVTKNCLTNENLNTDLNNIFRDIENSTKGLPSEEDFKGLFDDLKFNDNKLGSSVAEINSVLSKTLLKISDISFGEFWDNSIDAFGDAYEFLMTMYAKNAGKSGGEFFTPQEVSELLAKITLIDFNNLNQDHKYKTSVNRVYDPTCGSGSLLLKYAKILGKENVRDGFFGQEKNLTTYNLSRINMFLHDVPFNKFKIALGDTLTNPDRELANYKYDAIVSNPPYSTNWEGKDNPVLANDARFIPAGVLAPKSKADLAFTMHMLNYLDETGTAAIVEFPRVLYRSGAEAKIRKYLITNNFVDTIIQLPSDLFFGTSIATCILVLRKNRKNDDKVLFINASELFVRSDAKNKLSLENQNQILDEIINRKEIEHFSKLASIQEIEQNGWSLSVNTYVEEKSTKEVINIEELNKQIKETTLRVNELRAKIDEIVKELESKK
ncbi:type I restriction-modification system subunit M [Mycoplasma sp. NEAQ87857]|uniref:type I restriction-modification system subunit M n=1 Tax=Mycoplasma sp. NEAQ87857 TaxID=2683967 RepID=UPI00131967E7|nr:type I restriction-modification system subunit M [Mycoplasma sp. NEAQ87857]QGZ97550.1 type I restriction-modification system subunit M [Mycoplasma sp. NEAQ87857]